MIISFMNNAHASEAISYLVPKADWERGHAPSPPQTIPGPADWFTGEEALSGAAGHSKMCRHCLSLETGFAGPLHAKAARCIARALLKLPPEPCVKGIVLVHHRSSPFHLHLIAARRDVSHRPKPRNSKRRVKA
jgi:hypothetical protein